MREHAAVVIAAGLTAWSGGAARAQAVPPLHFAAESSSGQFVVLATGASGFAPNTFSDTNLVYLEPGLLTISCERIREALKLQLGLERAWTGKIFLAPFASDSPQDPVTIIAERFPSRRDYQVQMPNPLSRERYVEAVVRVLLAELANRGEHEHDADVPEWLTEGLAMQMLSDTNNQDYLVPQSEREPEHPETRRRSNPRRNAANAVNLAVDTYTTNFTRIDARRPDLLAAARVALSSHGALTFDELSWPSRDELAGSEHEVYSRSAQLFVTLLLGLEDGPASLRRMLAELPEHYNWQYAFFSAFQTHFGRPLEVEKWWALQVVAFSGREPSEAGAPERSWEELAEVLLTPAHIRAGNRELPETTEVPLQTVIREWGGAEQVLTLSAKIRQLEWLRLRLAPEVVPVADAYREALSDYLRRREQTPMARQPRTPAANAAHAVAVLDALDARRQGLVAR